MNKQIKISGRQIQAGMTIQIRGILPEANIQRKEREDSFIKRAIERGGRPWVNGYNKLIEAGVNAAVEFGGVKKSSPIVKVDRVDLDGFSWSYRSNGRQVAFNEVIIYTDQGPMTISTRQKVVLISK